MSDKENIDTRVCKACKKELPTSNFYFRKEKGDYRGCCKKCKRIRTKDQIVSELVSGKKTCKHCLVEKNNDEFQKAGGGKWLQPYCKECDSSRKKKWVLENKEVVVSKRKEYYLVNKDLISNKSKDYIKRNKEKVKERKLAYNKREVAKIKERNKEYGKRNRAVIYNKLKEKWAANPSLIEERRVKQKAYKESLPPEEKERRRLRQKEYRLKNRDKIKERRKLSIDKVREQRRAWSNKKAATDVQYRLKRNLRTRIRCALKPNNAYKIDKSEALLGCSIGFYKNYLQSLFTEGMTWERFMNGEIEIDHIKPCKLFDLRIESEQRDCFHYKNTQPLWMIDNLKKGAKYKEAA